MPESGNSIRPEAMAAAAWWASRLGNATQDAGDRDPGAREISAIATLASALLGRTFTDEQREAFRRELGPAIEAHLARWETGINAGAWQPDNPRWGAALRAITIDYGAHPVLREAADRAGITLRSLDLPMKTRMWINPGHVSVREGYSAGQVTVWDGTP